jgi:hypothetical protein
MLSRFNLLNLFRTLYTHFYTINSFLLFVYKQNSYAVDNVVFTSPLFSDSLHLFLSFFVGRIVCILPVYPSNNNVSSIAGGMP